MSRNMYIWAPVKTLYIWVVAIMVIAFGGAYRFPGFCRNQHIRDPTWSQNPFLLHRLGNRSRSCFDFRCFGDNSVAFILHSFHFLFLSFVLVSFQFPFIFLSCSFQSAFISFHLPFICMYFLLIWHSCPAISFLRLWKWVCGWASGPSATNGYR